MLKHKSAVTFSIAFLATVLSYSPAIAGDFELGCEKYKAKDYQQARTYFEKAAKTFPQNWLVRYYLANTYLTCSQPGNAKREYEACLSNKPDPSVAKYCQDAIGKLGGSSSGPSLVPALAAEADSSAAKPEAKPGSRAATIEAASQAIVTADQNNAEEILRKAKAQCTAIRAEAKEKIATGKHTGNQWYVRKDGTQYVDLDDEQKDAITKDAEDRCEAIMRTAESRAKALQH
ncbi:hypothetical protein BH11CYA1_BH11CYA1_14640 [soil metagenome]